MESYDKCKREASSVGSEEVLLRKACPCFIGNNCSFYLLLGGLKTQAGKPMT